MTALTVPSRPDEDASLRPVPWRRMVWVTWRQHRLAMTGLAVFLGALALCMWRIGVGLHQAYAAAAECHPIASPACDQLQTRFNGMDGFLSTGYVLQAVPALIGAFVGAPVLSRELETGTFRYAWTQGIGRWRWAIAKLVPLAVMVTAAAGAVTVLFSWYYKPYLATGNKFLPEESPLTNLFAVHGVVFAAWTLAAFAIGALAGMLIRRVVPAIAVTLAGYLGLAIAEGLYLREHYLAPLVARNLASPPVSAWVLGQWWTKAGVAVSQSRMNRVITSMFSRLIPVVHHAAGKGSDVKEQKLLANVDILRILNRHGYTQWTRYQPAGRFWPFQWIEAGWLLALSALLIATTVWLVRGRAS